MALDLQSPAVVPQLQQKPQQQQQAQSATDASMSALETLAEVSRQQLDPNGQEIPAAQGSKKRKRPSPGQSQAPQQPQLQPPTVPPQLLSQPQMQQQLPTPELLLHDPQLQALDIAGAGTDGKSIAERSMEIRS